MSRVCKSCIHSYLFPLCPCDASTMHNVIRSCATAMSHSASILCPTSLSFSPLATPFLFRRSASALGEFSNGAPSFTKLTGPTSNVLLFLFFFFFSSLHQTSSASVTNFQSSLQSSNRNLGHVATLFNTSPRSISFTLVPLCVLTHKKAFTLFLCQQVHFTTVHLQSFLKHTYP